MSRKQTVASLFNKFAAEEAEIAARVDALRAELSTLDERLAEVSVIRAALAAQDGATSAPARRAAPKKAAAKPAARKAAAKPAAKKAAAKPAAKKTAAKPAAKKAAKPAAKKAAAKPAAKKAAAPPKKAAAKGRKGRRKTGAKGLHSLGIVDAAWELAKTNGVAKADAGLVLDWFKAAGYKTRTGTPTRNSVYVSLNREAADGPSKGRTRISRPERGVFVFHFDA